MVLDVEPVAHVAAVAVDRQRLALERVQDHERDQLLGELEGAVVVRAVRDERRAGRRSRGRRARDGRRPPWRRRRASSARTASSSLKRPGRAERAVDLVGRDVEEAESALRVSLPAAPRKRRAASSSSKVPTTFVRMKAAGSSIERSTWVSAAKFTTALGADAAEQRPASRRGRRCRPATKANRRVGLDVRQALAGCRRRSACRRRRRGRCSCGAAAWRTKLQPMKPAPPVTRIVRMDRPLSPWGASGAKPWVGRREGRTAGQGRPDPAAAAPGRGVPRSPWPLGRPDLKVRAAGGESFRKKRRDKPAKCSEGTRGAPGNRRPYRKRVETLLGPDRVTGSCPSSLLVAAQRAAVDCSPEAREGHPSRGRQDH